MKHYRKSSHSIFDLKVHLVWIRKYRKLVLFGNVVIRLQYLIRKVCQTLDVEIFRGKEVTNQFKCNDLAKGGKR